MKSIAPRNIKNYLFGEFYQFISNLKEICSQNCLSKCFGSFIYILFWRSKVLDKYLRLYPKWDTSE